MKTPNSKIIRAQALKILVNHQNGLRTADLRRLTEQKLKNIIPEDNNRRGSYRSAIWDLDKRYPHYVKKETKSNYAIFVPTKQLIHEAEQIEIPYNNFTEDSPLEKKETDEYVNFKKNMVKLFEFIDHLKLEKFKIDDNLLRIIGFDEFKTIIKIMIHVEALREMKLDPIFKNTRER